MPRMQSFLVRAAVAAFAVGCQGADSIPNLVDSGPDAFRGPAQALFELPRPGMPPPSGFYALPFPNDIRVDEATGLMDLSDLPRPAPSMSLYFDAIAANVRGFSVTAASFVRFDAPIDTSSLPQTPEESQDGQASVYMVNVDSSSPGYGERVPLRFRFEEFAGETIGTNWLSVLPYPGCVLAEQTTYALVVTNRLRATDGTAVTRPAELGEVLAREESSDAVVARAQRIYAPLAAWLDGPGNDDREDVVSAAVFTTQDATSLMGKMREVIWRDLPMPKARNMRRLQDGPNFYWFDGIYDGPNFQQGTPPFYQPTDGGDIAVDAETGMPVIQRLEELRFSFSIPKGEMPEAGWPVVLYAHGTGGSYHSFVSGGVAERLAAEGLAVISIDQVMHPPRIPAGASPELLFFNFQNPLAARDNTLQGAADDFQLVRLVLDFEHSERKPGGIDDIRFDGNRIYFFGHSQGGITGPPFLAHEPLVSAAVLSGAGGLLYMSLLLKTEPVNVADLTATIIRDYPLDEFNPTLAMLQLFIDRADPVVYGPLLAKRPLPGVPAKHIFQTEGFTDRYTPVPSIEALATSMGVDLVEPVIAPVPGMALHGSRVVEAPIQGNRNGVTAVLLQYQQAQDSDGHFVVFDVPAAQVQSSRFLGGLAETGQAWVVAQ